VGGDFRKPICFGDFEIDLQTGKIRRDGRSVPLEPQPLRVLALLLERPGRIVSRDELRERIWGATTFVEFGPALNYCIRQIRRALGDDAAKPIYIETLPRQGYRCVASVRDAAPISITAPELAKPGPSIAILPFANFGADKRSGYFADGLVEELISTLARMPEIQVVGRTSSFFFRDKDIDLREIGKHLGVEHVLEGSIRRSGKRMRVTAQLIGTADGFHLWSERYDREITDIFALQDEIAAAIAKALRLRLSPKPSTSRRHTPNLRAYEAFLEGRHYLLVRPQPESRAKGKEMLERAIELDPEFALAYSVLGVYYTGQASSGVLPARQALLEAQAIEETALRLDDTLPEAHGMLAVCASMNYNWGEAKKNWDSALALEPAPSDVLFWYGNHYLLPLGRTEEAVEAEAKVLERDPLNPLYRRLYAIALQHAGRLQEAEEHLKETLQLGQDPLAIGMIGLLSAQQGRLDEALASTQRAYGLMPEWSPLGGQLAGLLVRARTKGGVGAIIEKIKSGSSTTAPLALAIFHALCGEFDQAAEQAHKAIVERLPLVAATLAPLMRQTKQWGTLAKLMCLAK
jgi:TolB-like protein/Tfp pilus assembly protein PilF